MLHSHTVSHLIFLVLEGELFANVLYFQIQHMMAFIDQEANEKAEEIDAKVCFILLSTTTDLKQI